MRADRKSVVITITAGLLYFYYLFLQSTRFFFTHFYEYYLRTLILSEYLPNFLQFFYYESFVNKLLYIRALPLFIAFRPSVFLYFYSSALLNISLSLLLLCLLTRSVGERRGFMLWLSVVSGYFFLELLASFYVDLTFFLFASMFFVMLYDIYKGRDRTWHLPLVILFLFITKNAAYLFVPLFIFFLVTVLVVQGRNRDASKAAISATLAFLAYFVLLLKADTEHLLNELGTGTSAVQSQPASLNPLSILVTLALYIIFAANLIRKRNLFWLYLFAGGQIYLIAQASFGLYYDPRFVLPLYFIYIYLLADFVKSIIGYDRLIILLLVMLAANLSFLYVTKTRIYSSHFSDLSLPDVFRQNSTLYIHDDRDIYTFNVGFYDFYPEYIDLEEKRLKFKVVQDARQADYVLCRDCSSFDGEPVYQSSKYTILLNPEDEIG